jgi:hypothetical protein
MNLAQNAESFKAGKRPGYVESAWEGVRESIDVIAERGIKVVINGGSINPSGLAVKISELVLPYHVPPLIFTDFSSVVQKTSV